MREKKLGTFCLHKSLGANTPPYDLPPLTCSHSFLSPQIPGRGDLAAKAGLARPYPRSGFPTPQVISPSR